MQSDSNLSSWVGVDVAQQYVDAAVVSGEQKKLEQRAKRSKEELKALAETLLKYHPQAVILEATGGLERMVMEEFSAAGLKVIRVNPARVRDFARAHGLLAKTDALDAYALALFGQRMQPEAKALPTPEQEELADWQVRQQQLTEQRAKERTRLKQCERAELRKSIERMIASLEKELARVQKKLQELVSRSQEWKQQQELLRSLSAEWREDRAGAAGGLAGAGPRQPARDCGSGGPGSFCAREWEVERTQEHSRRPGRRAERSLHRHLERRASAGKATQLLPGSAGRRQGQASRADCRGAEAAGGFE